MDTHYRVDQAEVIVALDADFLGGGPGSLRYARDFAGRRRPAERMNRLYAFESGPTITGSRADHRLALKPSEIDSVARHLASATGVARGGDALPPISPAAVKWVDAVARDLQAHRGASLVIAGESQTAEVHALVHAMNEALGNAGRTVIHTAPVEAEPVDHLQR